VKESAGESPDPARRGRATGKRVLHGGRVTSTVKRTQRSSEPHLLNLESDMVVEADVLRLAEGNRVSAGRTVEAPTPPPGSLGMGRVAKDSLGTWEILLSPPYNKLRAGRP
jgi:hypothetical protein